MLRDEGAAGQEPSARQALARCLAVVADVGPGTTLHLQLAAQLAAEDGAARPGSSALGALACAAGSAGDMRVGRAASGHHQPGGGGGSGQVPSEGEAALDQALLARYGPLAPEERRLMRLLALEQASG